MGPFEEVAAPFEFVLARFLLGEALEDDDVAVAFEGRDGEPNRNEFAVVPANRHLALPLAVGFERGGESSL